MATCCSVLAWRISGLQSVESQRVRRDRVTNNVHFCSKAAYERKWWVQGSVAGEESEMEGGGLERKQFRC